jgi:hypothetical protein
MDTQVLDLLLEKYQERINLLQDAIARGGCTSFEEYKYSCGQLRGLEAACLVVTDLKQIEENSDE